MSNIEVKIQELEFEKNNLLQVIRELKTKITNYETELIGITEQLRNLKEKQLEDNN